MVRSLKEPFSKKSVSGLPVKTNLAICLDLFLKYMIEQNQLGKYRDPTREAQDMCRIAISGMDTLRHFLRREEDALMSDDFLHDIIVLSLRGLPMFRQTF
jgi:hypothetical protein